jgi:uncharacterized membrane protein YfcA
MQSTPDRRSTPLIGLAAGIGSGLLGVGGGIIMVPLLTAFAGLSQHRAHATSLAAIIPIAAVGVIVFALDGAVDYGLAGILAAGSLLGVPIGAWIMSRIQEGLLMTLFGVLMIVVAVRLGLT